MLRGRQGRVPDAMECMHHTLFSHILIGLRGCGVRLCCALWLVGSRAVCVGVLQLQVMPRARRGREGHQPCQ